MKRRAFLRLLGTAPAVAAAPLIVSKLPLSDGVALFSMPHPTVTSSGKIIHHASFARALWPGVQKWWSDAYLDFKPEEW